MDIERVRRSATELLEAQAALADIEAKVALAVSNGSWIGPDAERARRDFEEQRVELREIGKWLNATGRRMQQNAADQETASNA
ncbi:MAG TPA: hypothetical protein PKD80_12525 [Microthrixaceae bacterium]|nr:hypothetical protein [Microthrixaceae bacterium]HMT24874.1 hypothetical protein [Microthrixaceae bacterium]HMT62075.1 hypothetical protein [Microthrixaceae bacterium]